jgi:ubiquinone/menaquinone biosynthesis C-methylase UbiE
LIDMLPRTLEPEVMDTAEEAADYDAMDHSTVNRAFVDEFLSAWSALCDAHPAGVAAKPSNPVRMLDVGTGTALIPIELARRDFPCRITAIDLAAEMLKLARQNVARAGLEHVIVPALIDAKGLPYADAAFDAVISNSIVHHIPQPRDTLAEMWRVLRPGGVLFVRDLLRPATDAEVEHLVAAYAGNESPRQQQLFRQSLHAALSVAEIGELLSDLGLPATWVRQSSDRHWTIAGRRVA